MASALDSKRTPLGKARRKAKQKLVDGKRLCSADIAALLATSVDGSTPPTTRSIGALAAHADGCPVSIALRAELWDGTRVKARTRVPLISGKRSLTGMCIAELALWAAIDDPPIEEPDWITIACRSISPITVVLAAITSGAEKMKGEKALQLSLPYIKLSCRDRDGADGYAAHAAEIAALDTVQFDSALAYHLLHVDKKKLLKRDDGASESASASAKEATAAAASDAVPDAAPESWLVLTASQLATNNFPSLATLSADPRFVSSAAAATEAAVPGAGNSAPDSPASVAMAPSSAAATALLARGKHARASASLRERMVGIDCEMCINSAGESQLARVTLVSHRTHAEAAAAAARVSVAAAASASAGAAGAVGEPPAKRARPAAVAEGGGITSGELI